MKVLSRSVGKTAHLSRNLALMYKSVLACPGAFGTKFTLRLKSLVLGALILASSSEVFGVTNSLTITEQAGVTTSNYPVQLGRPFVQGEIANYPQAIVNGTSVTTQADVKQRWPDGSVKHAVIAFLIPTLNANSSAIVTFQNQSSGNNAPLSQAQMLNPSYNFGAQMQLTNGGTIVADARTMLSNGSYTLWTSGSVAQTIIIADHSQGQSCNSHPCSQYDIGFDANKSFRPIFHATFWPALNKVTVRFIGENAQSQALQDQTYSLALTTGNVPSTQVYNKGSFTQSGATRWTKLFWVGGAPPAIAINHNLAYLTSTLLLPNFNTTVTTAASCNTWNQVGKDIGNTGMWTKYMPDAGSRPDIGIYEDWVINWLYSGSLCAHDAAFGNADLAASWPVHVREGQFGKTILRSDAAGSSTGLGHVISISGRPTVNLFGNFSSTPADQVNPVGPLTNQGWIYDTAHVPEPSSPAYLLSGDYWYLEELWFWSSFDVAADAVIGAYHRGPTGSEGILNHGQVRAETWELRNRINAASLSPDGTPEQTYFTTLTSDALACEEGTRNITTTAFNGTPIWNFCRYQFAPSGAGTGFQGSTGFAAGTPTPLHQWNGGGGDFAQDEYGICSSTGDGTPCVPATVSAAASLFESDYMLFTLGRAKELGYPAGALLSSLGSLYTGMLTDPGFNPYMVDNGRVPTVDINGNYFSTFAGLKTGYNPGWQARTSFATVGDPDGYLAYATAGVSYLTGEPNGAAAWTFLAVNGIQPSTYTVNPKWALIPRFGTTQAVRCDINGDGKVDVLDVQLSVSQTLGQATCSADLDGNGKCDVLDVQRVVNAALGAACRIGP
jgi:hypothetical protein